MDKGMPYYEKIRKDLRDMLNRKKHLDRSLAHLEDQIAKFEASYLEDTPNGNIIKGFDNYIKGTTARRKNAISDSDRVFSNSSVTSLKLREQDEAGASAAATATAGLSSAAASSTPTTDQTLALSARDGKLASQKRKTVKRRKGDDESESPSEVETPGPKRVRISFSRGPT